MSLNDNDNLPIYSGYAKPPKGAYAKHPGATPKYSLLNGARGNDFTDTQARLYLSRAIGKPPDHLKTLATAVSSTDGYVDFILQGVEQGFREKVDVIETLNDHYVAYFFGAAAEQWTFRGTFLNTKEDNQFLGFFELYEKWLRGTKLADYRRTVSLQYNGIIVLGAITSLATSLNSEMETAMPFTFTLLVKSVNLVSHHEEFAVINGGQAKPSDDDLVLVPLVNPADVRTKAPPLSQETMVELATELRQAEDVYRAAVNNQQEMRNELERLEESAIAEYGFDGDGSTAAGEIEGTDKEIEEIKARLASRAPTDTEGIAADEKLLTGRIDYRNDMARLAEAYQSYRLSQTAEQTARFARQAAKDAYGAAENVARADSPIGDFTPGNVGLV